MEWIGSLVSGKVENNTESTSEMSEEDEYRAVVKKLIAWYETPKNEDGTVEREEFLKRLDATYAKDFVRYSEGDEEANFEKFRAEADAMCNAFNFDFKLFRYKQLEPGVMDVFVRYSTSTNDVVVQGKYYYRNAMVYKTEVTRTLKKKANGQISATDKEIVPNLTEKELGRRVHETTSVLNGKMLGFSKGMEPVAERYEILKTKLHYQEGNKNFLNGLFRVRERIRVLEDDDSPYDGGAFFRYARRNFGLYKSLTLFNGKTEAVAFCEKNDLGGFTIFGTHTSFDDEMSKRMFDCGEDQSDVVAFYPWFRVQKEGTVTNIYFVLVATEVAASGKVRFEPLYKLTPAEHGRQRFYLMQEYDPEKTNQGGNLAVVRAEKDQKHEGKTVEIYIAPGVDPAMMLCIAATLEELKNA